MAGTAELELAGNEGCETGPVIYFRSDPEPVSLVRALELFRTAGIVPDTALFTLAPDGAGAESRISFPAGTRADRFAVVVRKVSQLPGVHSVKMPDI